MKGETTIAEKVLLLVEDNPDDEMLILRALRRNNVANKIVVARDGEEALDYLYCTGTYASRDPHETPQVVLLDLKLPKVDGLEVLRRMRDDPATKFLPVVILTSSDEEKDMITSYQLGANSYIRKPIVFQDFIEAVVQLGVYWFLLNKVVTKPGDK